MPSFTNCSTTYIIYTQ